MMNNTLFNSDIDKFLVKESEKERNLYYKIFAGYIFNPFVDGYEKRMEGFTSLIREISYKSGRYFYKEESKYAVQRVKELIEKGFFVSFDYHYYQGTGDFNDRGEMSDIILWGDNSIISIEVKYLSNWSFSKDISCVQDRIQAVTKRMNIENSVQILLLKEKKWEYSTQVNRHRSQGKYLMDNEDKLKYPLFVLFWEDLISIICDDVVEDYLKKSLTRDKTSNKKP